MSETKSSSPFAKLAALEGTLPPGPTRPASRDAEEPAPSVAFAGKIVVAKERKGHGGKTCTRISGVALAARELEALASEMKRTLGCGGSVDGTDVVLAGEQGERAVAFLRARGATRVVIGS